MINRYYVQEEWAKQLALEAYPQFQIDFANLRFHYVENDSFYIIPERKLKLSMYDRPMYHYVMMELWFDGLNRELTSLGYEPLSNTLCVGYSRVVPVQEDTDE